MFRKLLIVALFVATVADANSQTKYPEVDSLIGIVSLADEKSKASIYNKICWKLRDLESNRALEYGELGLKYALENSDTFQIIKSYSYIGVCQRNCGNLDEAFKNYDAAFELAIESGNIAEVAYSLVNKGNLYIYNNEYNKALVCLDSAIAMGKSLNDSVVLGYCYLNKGRVKLDQNEANEAWDYLSQAVKIREELNAEWDAIASVKKYLGDAAQAKGDYALALKLYKEAEHGRKVPKTELVSDLYGRISRMYLYLRVYDSAMFYARICLDASIERGIPYRVKNAHEHLGDIYATINNYPKAIEQYKIVMGYADTFYNQQRRFGMSNIEYKLEKIKRENEIALLRKDRKLHNSYYIINFLLISILLGAALFLVRKNKNAKKINKILEEQKSNISARNDELSKQRDLLKMQRDMLEHQATMLENQKFEITDSIAYARQIQLSMIPPENGLMSYFSDSFIFYRPKDVVSGDFYWFFNDDKYFIVMAADCTGHGVPGAFMSMLGMSLLNDVVRNYGLRDAGKILNIIRELVKKTLNQRGDSSDKMLDGMDAALLVINKQTNILEYSGANIPFLCYRGDEEITIKPVRNPIGVYIKEIPFVTHDFALEKDDKIYLASDGLLSQFGGNKDKRLQNTGYKNLLKETMCDIMEEQKKLIKQKFLQWKGHNKQTDDIMVLGMKV